MPALFRWHQRSFLIGSIILAAFIILSSSSVTNSSPVISQVQISGAGNKSKQDFIKIFNPDPIPFDLKGHRLIKRTQTGASDSSIKSFTAETIIPAGGYFTWANSEDGFADSLGADSATTNSLSPDNGIALRQGAIDEGVIIDSVAWGEADNGLAEGAIFATNPSAGQILTRKNNTDTDNNAADFYLAEPADSNETNTPATPNQSSNGSASVSYTNQIFINELVSDPSDDATEWVELYNSSNQSFNLDRWTLEDGSGTKTILSGSITKYLVINSPKGNLNNAGDILILKDPSGQVIDTMSYGDWLEGKTNAPVAKKSHSLALKTDGSSTGLDADDWAITSSITKNASNLISSDDSNSTSSDDSKITCPLIINEVLPDPLGADLLGEFIEIYNPGNTTIDLIGWSLSTSNQLPYIFGLQSLAPLNYLSLPRSISKLVLANDGATINLSAPASEKVCFKLKYTKASPGASYGFNNDTLTWSKPREQWSRQPTPGGTNSNLTINQAPNPVINYSLSGETISFDASDTSDPNADNLSFEWQFGDGASSLEIAGSHLYNTAGSYIIKLSASDGSLTASTKLSIKIGDSSSSSTKNTLVSPSKIIPANNPPQTKTKTTNTKSNTVKKSSTSTTSANNSTIELTGSVLDRPGTFSSLYFFMLPSGESQAWQIYRQKGQLPELAPGQQISVHGRRSSIANIKRLLITETSDISIGDLGPLARATPIQLDQASNYLGQLVTVSGEVTDRAKDSFYLDDDSTDILVRLKAGTGLVASSFNPGTNHTVSGLLVMGSQELELWPRSLTDTDLNTNSSADKLSPTSSLATSTEAKTNQELLAHILIGLGTLLVISAIIMIKRLKNKANIK